MMILDDYVPEDQGKQTGGGNTPMLRRSSSTTNARHLPPIRETSKSISRRNDIDNAPIQSSYPQVVKPLAKKFVVRELSKVDI